MCESYKYTVELKQPSNSIFILSSYTNGVVFLVLLGRFKCLFFQALLLTQASPVGPAVFLSYVLLSLGPTLFSLLASPLVFAAGSLHPRFPSTSPHTTLNPFPPTGGHFSVSVLFPQAPSPHFSLFQLSVLNSRVLVF